MLHYRFTGEQEVNLLSTYVPEAFRGQGVAALLAQVRSSTFALNKSYIYIDYLMLCSVLQAALDFLSEEHLKARVSCWYIQKYIEEQPLERYKDLVISTAA